MKLLCLSILAFSAALPAAAQVNRDDLTPLENSYTTAVSEDRQSFLIELEVTNVSRPTL